MKTMTGAVLWALLQSVHAEVTTATDYGFAITQTLQFSASRQRVFSTLVERVGEWWDAAHTYSGNAANLSIEAVAQGCFCERLEQGSVRHLTVVYVDQGRMLRLAGGLGPLQELGVAGSLTLQLEDADPGATRLVLSYNVGGYLGNDASQWPSAVDAMLGQQLARLRRLIENGDAGLEIQPH